MKSRFKTNKLLTAVEETGHTITTTEGRILHLKFASNPLKIQPSKKFDEPKKPTSKCCRCGWFSNGKYCDTYRRTMAENNPATSTSSTLLTQNAGEWQQNGVDITYLDNRDGIAKEHPCANEENPEDTDTAGDAPEDGNEEVEIPAEPFNSPMPSFPVAYSTERTIHKPVHNNTATPSGPTKRKGNLNLEIDSKERKTFVKFEELIVRTSDRIKTARRVKKTRRNGILLNQK